MKYLHINVKDNLIGRSRSILRFKFIETRESSGIVLIEQRLALLSPYNGLYNGFNVIGSLDEQEVLYKNFSNDLYTNKFVLMF